MKAYTVYIWSVWQGLDFLGPPCNAIFFLAKQEYFVFSKQNSICIFNAKLCEQQLKKGEHVFEVVFPILHIPSNFNGHIQVQHNNIITRKFIPDSTSPRGSRRYSIKTYLGVAWLWTPYRTGHSSKFKNINLHSDSSWFLLSAEKNYALIFKSNQKQKSFHLTVFAAEINFRSDMDPHNF